MGGEGDCETKTEGFEEVTPTSLAVSTQHRVRGFWRQLVTPHPA